MGPHAKVAPQPSSSATGDLIVPPWQTKKKFAAFLSHHQRDSAMEARYLKEQPEAFGHDVLLAFSRQ